MLTHCAAELINPVNVVHLAFCDFYYSTIFTISQQFHSIKFTVL
nr:MAG TPA: hypothetical protein [Caudoviricetes sp.]